MRTKLVLIMLGSCILGSHVAEAGQLTGFSQSGVVMGARTSVVVQNQRVGSYLPVCHLQSSDGRGKRSRQFAGKIC